MEITFENIGIIVLILLTGLSAGLCFTWSNAITTGIGRLDDLNYLRSFQQMNRTIINPLFILIFFGPSILGPINWYLFKNVPSQNIWLLVLAISIYFIGVVMVTLLGNVPLNEVLDKTNLQSASSEELSHLRERFEGKWNRLHFIRTLSSIISFLILLISFVQATKVKIQ